MSVSNALRTNENFEPNILLQFRNVIENYGRIVHAGRPGPPKILYTHQIIGLIEDINVVGPQAGAFAPRVNLLSMMLYMLGESREEARKKIHGYIKSYNRLMDNGYKQFPNYRDIFNQDMELLEWVNEVFYNFLWVKLRLEAHLNIPETTFTTERIYIPNEEGIFVRMMKIEIGFNGENESMNNLMNVRYKRKVPCYIPGHGEPEPSAASQSVQDREATPFPASEAVNTNQPSPPIRRSQSTRRARNRH